VEDDNGGAEDAEGAANTAEVAEALVEEEGGEYGAAEVILF
jgi:hypothetical protein